jgi:hypothetical protein
MNSFSDALYLIGPKKWLVLETTEDAQSGVSSVLLVTVSAAIAEWACHQRY